MELAQCIICREALKLEDIVAGVCGHTFHTLCISQWQRNVNNCPQCRQCFRGREPIKLFFDTPDEEEKEEFANDPAFLKGKVRHLSAKLEEKEESMNNEKKKVKAAKKELKGTRSELEAVREALEKSDIVNNALKRQLQFLDKHKEEAQKAKQTADVLQRNLDTLQAVDELIKGEKEDVEIMLQKFHKKPDALHQVITSFVIMKKEFEKLKDAKEKMNDKKKSLRREIDDARRKMQSSMTENLSLKEQLKLAETDMLHLEREKQNLMKKITHLEQAFASPSPRASAIKRLLKESPAPISAKKARTASYVERANPVMAENVCEGDLFEEEDEPEIDVFDEFSDSFNELASEIGLKVVNTTSITTNQGKKMPLAKVNINIKPTINWQTQSTSSSSSSSSGCAAIQKGYNGLGGQTRFVKPSVTKRLSSRVKVPKSAAVKNTKPINAHFVPKRNPPLPNFSQSP